MSALSGRPFGRRYSEQFKVEAVAMVTELGKSQAEVCRDLGLNSGTMSRWVNSAARTAAYSRGVSVSQTSLESENRRLRLENEFLKKAAVFFATESG